MSVLIEFAMFPTDKGESVSSYVSGIIKMIDESGFNFQLTSMGTIIETETLDEALEIIRKAHSILDSNCNRIYSSIKLDIRKDKTGRLTQKIESIEKKLGRKLT